MREPKFRAWDAFKSRGMSKPFGLGCREVEYDDGSTDAVDFVLQNFMQFTGLHDKNGKEICAGDVCRFDNGDMFVVDSEKWVQFYGRWINDPQCEDQLRDWYRAGNSEIIGNLHEHPELLPPQEKDNG